MLDALETSKSGQNLRLELERIGFGWLVNALGHAPAIGWSIMDISRRMFGAAKYLHWMGFEVVNAALQVIK